MVGCSNCVPQWVAQMPVVIFFCVLVCLCATDEDAQPSFVPLRGVSFSPGEKEKLDCLLSFGFEEAGVGVLTVCVFREEALFLGSFKSYPGQQAELHGFVGIRQARSQAVSRPAQDGKQSSERYCRLLRRALLQAVFTSCLRRQAEPNGCCRFPRRALLQAISCRA